MKRLLYLIIYIACQLSVSAQTIVRDSQDGQPVIQASVYDEQGKIIGITDADGRLPQLGDVQNIRLTHISYQPLDVTASQIGHELRMTPAAHPMREVVKERSGKAYCLKLTCYRRRYMVNGKGTHDDLPPVVCFIDGLCELYIFKDGWKETRCVNLNARDVITGDMLPASPDETLPNLTIYPMTEPVFKALPEGESKQVNLHIAHADGNGFQSVGTFTMIKDLRNSVYQPAPGQARSQGHLIAYSETKRLQGELRKKDTPAYKTDLWYFDEYFPVMGEYITKKEYKKEDKSTAPTAADIDRCISELQVPELSSVIQLKLEHTRNRPWTVATQPGDNGQHTREYTRRMPQERIYLQTDKPYYAAGDTVWFRAHLMDAATNVPVSRSRFVYVELHDQEADTLCQRLMVKANEDGVFANALLLPKDLPGGVYTLVAYTQWMRNFPAERFCYQPLTVAGGQRVRGHRIPLHHLSQHGAKVKVSGKAATENSPMTVDIDISDQGGLPLSGTFALSVTDYDVVKPDSLFGDIRQSLLRQQYADTPDSAVTITYPFQEQQFITGSVKGSLGQHIKQPHLLVVNNRTGHREEFELGDSTRFTLAVDNPNGTTFTLEGTRRSGRTSFVKLQIDPLTFPELKLPHYRLATDTADLAAFTAQAQAQQRYNRAGYIELPEVEKVGKKHLPQKRNIMSLEAPRGFPAGDMRIENAANVQQLLTTLGMRVYYINGEATITTTDNAGLKVYVDNFVETDHDYVLNLIPQNISSIEYFTPNNAVNGFFGVRPGPTGKVPGVLFVFLKDGSEIVHSKSSRPLSMATVQQLGYEQPVEFYSPQYPDPAQKTRPDHRTTLYWNPAVKTDADGRATIRFYASDVSKRYLVTLEGVSDNGTVVHQQQIIE